MAIETSLKNYFLHKFATFSDLPSCLTPMRRFDRPFGKSKSLVTSLGQLCVIVIRDVIGCHIRSLCLIDTISRPSILSMYSAKRRAKLSALGEHATSTMTKAVLGGMDSFEKELVEGMNLSLQRIKAEAER